MGFQALKILRERSALQARLRSGLKADLAQALNLSVRDIVQVNEIACPDPGCPDTTTVVLVMREGEPTRGFRIAKPLDAMTRDDCAGVAESERLERAGAV